VTKHARDVLRDGESALDRAEHEEYDLVICDLKMPGMDGQKFFSRSGCAGIRCRAACCL